MPGVLVLDAALGLVLAHLPGRALAGVASAKFLRPILPEQEIAVRCLRIADERIGFQCDVEGTVALRGTALLR